MSTIQTHIAHDRECDHCGYNLKGLQPGGKCPECGNSIRRVSINTSGTMSEEAPTRFVKKLRLGFLLASIPSVITFVIGVIILIELLFLQQISVPKLTLVALFSLPWPVGAFLATLPRPGKGSIRPDAVLDSSKLRLTVRVCSIAWPVYTLSTLALVSTLATGTPSRLLVIATGAMSAIAGVVAWIGLIPTSIYFAEIAYWSSNDNLAHRLRGTAWVLGVLGSACSVMIGLALVQDITMAIFIAVPIALIMLAALTVFNIGVVQLAHATHWVVNNQDHASGSFERKEERRKREEQYKGRIVDDTPCDFCGFNLIGLEPGNPCPECGTLISHPTIPAIRDPAKARPYHDNTPIDLDEHGENKGVFFNEQLDARGKPKAGGTPYTPQTEVPDDGDIPLSPDDEEEDDKPKKTIRHDTAKDDSLKPRSFDDDA